MRSFLFFFFFSFATSLQKTFETCAILSPNKCKQLDKAKFHKESFHLDHITTRVTCQLVHETAASRTSKYRSSPLFQLHLHPLTRVQNRDSIARSRFRFGERRSLDISLREGSPLERLLISKARHGVPFQKVQTGIITTVTRDARPRFIGFIRRVIIHWTQRMQNKRIIRQRNISK